MTQQEKSFAELFQSFNTSSLEGKVVKGKIIDFDGNYAIIDVGLKSEGRVEISEFSTPSKKSDLKIGEIVDVYIDRYEDRSGEIVLSRDKALKEAAWDDLEKCMNDKTRVFGAICGKVKGGFIVDIDGSVAFLPGSQVDMRPIKDISPLMGIVQPFIILKMDKIRGNIVVSRRAILEEANIEDLERVMASIEEGQIVKGIVKNITHYGAFIDIGGFDGLLHNTDISWKRVNHPSDVLAIGQEIEVKITKKENKRIALGLKQLEKDPWEGIDIEFPVGSKVAGRVTNVTDYGIFVEIKECVEGLVYVSEISWKKNISPQKVVSAGAKIDVMILDVDINKRRIGLGIKQLKENPWDTIMKEYAPGYEFESTISNVADFGIFVKITDEIDGMVHMNDLAWDKQADAELAKYKRGDKIKVKVLEVESEKERISLSVKHLQESPYKDVVIDVKKGAVVTCTVTGVQADGINVILADGMQGFVKKIDLAKDKQDRRTDRFAVGEKFDAKISSIDKSGKRAILSVKELEIEEEKQAMEEYGSSDSGASLGDILGAAFKK